MRGEEGLVPGGLLRSVLGEAGGLMVVVLVDLVGRRWHVCGAWRPAVREARVGLRRVTLIGASGLESAAHSIRRSLLVVVIVFVHLNRL